MDNKYENLFEVCTNLEKMLRHKDEEIDQMNRHCEYIMKLYYESQEKLAQKSAVCLQLQTRIKLCTCDLKPGLWINNARALVRMLREDELLEQELDQHMAREVYPYGTDVGHSLDTQMRIRDDRLASYKDRESPMFRSIQYGRNVNHYYWSDQEGAGVSPYANINGNNNEMNGSYDNDLLTSQSSLGTVKERSILADVLDDSPFFAMSREGSVTERPYSVVMSDDMTSSKADVLTIDKNLHRSFDGYLHDDITEEASGTIAGGETSQCTNESVSEETTRVENGEDKMLLSNGVGFNEYEMNCKHELDVTSECSTTIKSSLLDKCDPDMTCKQLSSPDQSQPVVNSHLMEDHPSVSHKKLKPKAISYTLEILPSKVSIYKPRKSQSPHQSSATNNRKSNCQSQVQTEGKMGNEKNTNMNKLEMNTQGEKSGDISVDSLDVRTESNRWQKSGGGRHISDNSISNSNNIKPNMFSEDLLDTHTEVQLTHRVHKSAHRKYHDTSKFTNIAKKMEGLSTASVSVSAAGQDTGTSLQPEMSQSADRETVPRGVSKSQHVTKENISNGNNTTSKSLHASVSRKNELKKDTTYLDTNTIRKTIYGHDKKCNSMSVKSPKQDGDMAKSVQLEKRQKQEKGCNMSKSLHLVEHTDVTHTALGSRFRNVTYTKEEIFHNMVEEMSQVDVGCPPTLRRKDTFTKEEFESNLGSMTSDHQKTDSVFESDKLDIISKTTTAVDHSDIDKFQHNISGGHNLSKKPTVELLNSIQQGKSATAHQFLPHRPNSARGRQRDTMREVRRPKTAGSTKLLEQKPGFYTEKQSYIKDKSDEACDTSQSTELLHDTDDSMDVQELPMKHVGFEEADHTKLDENILISPRRCSTPHPYRPSEAKNKKSLARTWSELS